MRRCKWNAVDRPWTIKPQQVRSMRILQHYLAWPRSEGSDLSCWTVGSHMYWTSLYWVHGGFYIKWYHRKRIFSSQSSKGTWSCWLGSYLHALQSAGRCRPRRSHRLSRHRTSGTASFGKPQCMLQIYIQIANLWVTFFPPNEIVTGTSCLVR